MGGVRLCQLVLVVIFVLFAVVAARGQLLKSDPSFGGQVDVVENLGGQVPLDVPIVTTTGDTVTLGSYFEDELPVLLILHYNDCPMLCGLVLDGLTKTIRNVPLTPGEDYRIVTVSINPDESPEFAGAYEERYRSELPEEAVGPTWHFHVAPPASIDTLASAVGFEYFYDEKSEQYAHPAVVHVLTDEGTISRYLYGIEYSPTDLRLAILEAGRGKVGDTVDKIVLYCMHYDPDSEGYVVFAENVMKLAGLATVVFLGVFVGGYWVRERVRRGGGGEGEGEA